jgi:hypothetical protein
MFFLALAGFGTLLGLDLAKVHHFPWWVIGAPLWGFVALYLVLAVVFGTFFVTLSKLMDRD